MSKQADFQKLIARIIEEKRHGDITTACDNVGVTDTVFETAKKKTSVDDLSPKEQAVIAEMVDILDSRKEQTKALKAKILESC